MLNLPMTCPKNYGQCGVTIEYNPGKLFVLMPFREEQAPQKLFTDVLEKLPGWTVLRADREFTKPEIWCKICANIQESRAIIADLSNQNANVFLELGLAWGAGRPFVLLAQDFRNLPFDTRSFHVIKYERDSNDSKEVANPEVLTKEILQSLNALPELPPLTRIPIQTPEGYLNQRIAHAKSRVVREFWKLDNGTWKVVGLAKEAHRIALALIRAYPETRQQKEIVEETNLHSGSVSRILTGGRGGFAKYFLEINNEWTLSNDGIYWILDDVIPSVLASLEE
ncbi:MAG: hypothetical protein ACXACG_12200 [Candidatus Thorarchaeota archaeon]